MAWPCDSSQGYNGRAGAWYRLARAMGALNEIYRSSLGLLVDLYELTMAYGYWKTGMWKNEAVFHLHFRKPPFGGGFTLACGLAPAIEFIEGFRFAEEDLDYLAGLPGDDGSPLFDSRLPRRPAAVGRSPAISTPFPRGRWCFRTSRWCGCAARSSKRSSSRRALLNLINFQTLIATKAARVCLAAQGDPVIEFGLRRAQGIDGGLAASRAAYVGGCGATSNVLAGKLFGIPVKGTHAHSWVISFDSELEAFDA